MNLREARDAVEGSPKSWLGGAARVLLAELDRLDASRIGGLESDRALLQAKVASLQQALDEATSLANYYQARSDSATARALDAEAKLSNAIRLRDEAADEAEQAHVDSNEYARLLRLEHAVRGVRDLRLRGPISRRVRDRIMEFLSPHLTRR